MIHITCRLTAKNRDQLRNLTLGNQVWATFTLFTTALAGKVMISSVLSVRPPVYTLAEKPPWLRTLIFRICMVTTIACWEHESQSAVMNSTVVMVMQSIWHQSFINGSLFSSLGLCSNVVIQVHWGSLLKFVNRDSIISRTVQSRRREGTGQNAQNMCGDLGNWWVARGMDVLHVHPTSQEMRS